jgi:hypothetical protein
MDLMAESINYKSSSPYSTTGLFQEKFLDILEYRTIPEEKDDVYRAVTATYHRRPDLMSFDLYGSVDFWWIFMMRNRDIIIDPIWDFTEDKMIYVPKLSTILASLG